MGSYFYVWILCSRLSDLYLCTWESLQEEKMLLTEVIKQVRVLQRLPPPRWVLFYSQSRMKNVEFMVGRVCSGY